MSKNFTRKRSPKTITKSNSSASWPQDWVQRDWLFALFLVLCAILVYLPVWHAGFIWDDDGHVTRPDLRTWTGLVRIWFKLGATQQYYPVVHSFFWVEHRLWGDWPLGYHCVNIVLHACSAFLLFKILQQLQVPGRWLAAAIFALHPMQVESVAWVSELKNVLSGVFYFSAALAYLKFDRTRETKPYLVALLFFVLAVMSKSVTSSFPAAMLVLFWWARGKLSWKQDVLALIPFFIIGICGGLCTAWVERHFIGAEGADFNYTLIERTLIAGHALWFYFSKIIWPTDLAFIYPRWHISQGIWWQYFFPGAALVVAVILVWLSKRWRGPLAGFLFFAGTLFPALGYINVYPFRFSFVADHFQYIACLGVIVPCAAGMTRLADLFLPGKLWLQSGLAIGLLIVLGVVSWQRTWVYESQVILWTDTLKKNPDCWMAHNNLGLALFNEGQVDGAIVEYRKALGLYPDSVEALCNLGKALAIQGGTEEAITQYKRAVAIHPNDAVAHHDLGLALDQDNQIMEAIAEYQKAIEIDPDYSLGHYDLGIDLDQRGQVNDAIDEYQKALSIDPNNAEAHCNLGIALAQTGRLDEASNQFMESLRLKPDLTQARDNLARAQAILRQGGAQ